MRRTVAIFGTLLIAAIFIITGSAVAQTWHWIDHYEPLFTVNCSYPWKAEDAPDNDYASLGEHIPPADPVLGWALLDLDSGNEMGPSQDFTVFAVTPVNESYAVWVSVTTNLQYKIYVGSGWDTENLTFQTPSQPVNAQWRYILLVGTSGVADAAGGDHAYGADIDAVGWH